MSLHVLNSCHRLNPNQSCAVLEHLEELVAPQWQHVLRREWQWIQTTLMLLKFANYFFFQNLVLGNDFWSAFINLQYARKLKKLMTTYRGHLNWFGMGTFDAQDQINRTNWTKAIWNKRHWQFLFDSNIRTHSCQENTQKPQAAASQGLYLLKFVLTAWKIIWSTWFAEICKVSLSCTLFQRQDHTLKLNFCWFGRKQPLKQRRIYRKGSASLSRPSVKA